MPRYLLLMRHAQAEEIISGSHDRERELTAQGQKEALQVATQLSHEIFQIEKIYHSIATRTSQTANLIADVIKLQQQSVIPIEDLYNSSVRTYLSFIHQLSDEERCVAIVGHNPTVSYLSEYLSGEPIGSLPTGGVVLLKTEQLSWRNWEKDKAQFIQQYQPNPI
ncbi:MAG: phosphohistidine phosphatase SixA [Cyclobacteriaceae bacterium]|jgi:phosphohistidine phosphatase|nr:phosphohistidine phosphatase SixA [Cytophagales bacterium]MCZ8328791.1 phosphohistidine phosphatase SixA [Cyclobacteriaceae bacterium]